MGTGDLRAVIYQGPLWWRLSSVAWIAVPVWFAQSLSAADNPSPFAEVIVATLLVVLAAALIVGSWRRQVVLTADTLEIRTLTRTTVLGWDEINGTTAAPRPGVLTAARTILLPYWSAVSPIMVRVEVDGSGRRRSGGPSTLHTEVEDWWTAQRGAVWTPSDLAPFHPPIDRRGRRAIRSSLSGPWVGLDRVSSYATVFLGSTLVNVSAMWIDSLPQRILVVVGAATIWDLTMWWWRALLIGPHTVTVRTFLGGARRVSRHEIVATAIVPGPSRGQERLALVTGDQTIPLPFLNQPGGAYAIAPELRRIWAWLDDELAQRAELPVVTGGTERHP